MSELKPYRHDRSCPKCGQRDIHVVWVKAQPFLKKRLKSGLSVPATIGNRLMEGRLSAEEHMHRSCRTCQYEWAEAPLDSCSAIDRLASVGEST